MAAGNREVEIKVRIEKMKPLFAFLEKNAKHVGKTRQVDEYFVPAHRNFLVSKPIKEWLRLRNQEGSASMNYKFWHYESDGKARAADEFETRVEDANQMERILRALDMKPIVKVDKVRNSWRYKNYEIGVDEVSGLGTFVEIECRGRVGDSKRIASDMVAFLRKIGVGRIERNYQGYPYLMLFPKQARHH